MARPAGKPTPQRRCSGESSDVPGLSGKRAFLESGEAWPGEPPPECIETHASLIFLTGDRAWKLKKPVRLHHIDLSNLSARAHFCREELRLNRELAGEVYLRVVPLVLRPDGCLEIGGEGSVADWLIEMRRLPEDQMLDRRLIDGPQPDVGQIERAADVLVRFYFREPGRPGSGTVYLDRLRTEARTNAAHLRALWDRVGWRAEDDILNLGLEMLQATGDEIVNRGERGLIVEGHGDLRPEHVCLLDPPVIFDRVEFDHSMRLVDPFEEFNYLGLECAMLGAGWIRKALLSRLEGSGLPPPSARLGNTYGVNRCLTRARLAIDHLLDEVVRTPEKWPVQARRYLDAARTLSTGGNGF